MFFEIQTCHLINVCYKEARVGYPFDPRLGNNIRCACLRKLSLLNAFHHFTSPILQ